MDWENFNKILGNKLKNAIPSTEPSNKQDFYHVLQALMESVTSTFKEAVLIIRLSPHMKRWWTRELLKLWK